MSVLTNNLFVVGAVVAVVYFILKFLEMRFVETDAQKPMKVLIRDTLAVCISAVAGIYLLEQFNVLGKIETQTTSAPAVFVDTPGF